MDAIDDPARQCKKCCLLFVPIESIERRLRAQGSTSKVCPACVLSSIENMAEDAIDHMTDEEIEAELREDGVDVDAFLKRVNETIERAKHGAGEAK